jgi:hypothetical protein
MSTKTKVNLLGSIYKVTVWTWNKGIKTSVHLKLQKEYGFCGYKSYNNKQLLYFLENMELDEKLFFHLVNLTILNEFIT